MLDALYIIIGREKTNIIQLIFDSYAHKLEAPFLRATGFSWEYFIGNIAVRMSKPKSFETIINQYRQYINIADKNNLTYLGYVFSKFKLKESLEYAKIIIKYDGTTKLKHK